MCVGVVGRCVCVGVYVKDRSESTQGKHTIYYIRTSNRLFNLGNTIRAFQVSSFTSAKTFHDFISHTFVTIVPDHNLHPARKQKLGSL